MNEFETPQQSTIQQSTTNNDNRTSTIVTVVLLLLLILSFLGNGFLFFQNQRLSNNYLDVQRKIEQLENTTAIQNSMNEESLSASNINSLNQEQKTIQNELLIVKRAIIKQSLPGEKYFTPYVEGYEDITIKVGEIFSLEALMCEECSTVQNLKLKLIDIGEESIIVETQYPYWENTQKELHSGDTINPNPEMLDVSSSYTFQFEKKDSQLVLTYSASSKSTMPLPSN